MILYNTLMGVCAALTMLLMASAARVIPMSLTDVVDAHTSRQEVRGYGLALLAVGAPLTVLAGAMTLTWPLTVNPPVNIAFAEPTLLLGVLALLAGVWLSRMDGQPVRVTPVLWVIHALGWVLAAIASAIGPYDLIGDAPAAEPISGQFTGWENTAFTVVYALAALGCLAAPWALSSPLGNRVLRYSFRLAGFALLAFSVLNYRTHIGLLINTVRGTHYHW